MQRVKIYSLEQSCDICTEIPEIISDLKSYESINFIRKKIPAGRISFMEEKDSPRRINVYKSNNQKVLERYPHYEISNPNISYRDSLALSEYLLERARQEEGIYNLHSSTVGINGNCVVIHGASKSGKTVISLNSHQNKGLEFLTNERTLIDFDKEKIVGGCELLDIRDYHKKLFPSLKDVDEFELENWKSEEYKIKCIVYPSIDSGLKKLIFERKDIISAEWLLYPEFTSRIRGDNKRLFNLKYPLDSLDTKDLALKRINLLNKFLTKITFYFVRGSVLQISDFIKNQL